MSKLFLRLRRVPPLLMLFLLLETLLPFCDGGRLTVTFVTSPSSLLIDMEPLLDVDLLATLATYTAASCCCFCWTFSRAMSRPFSAFPTVLQLSSTWFDRLTSS